jgi:hypothetical protein
VGEHPSFQGIQAFATRLYDNLKRAVHTSHETHYVSVTNPIRSMLFRETVAVYCENHTEQKYTLWAENSVRTSHEIRYVSATNPNRSALFRETVAVYCENHIERIVVISG